MANDTKSPAFPLAPAVMGDDHSGKVSEAPEHLIPYGIILEEYAVRRAQELREKAILSLGLPAETCETDVWAALRQRIAEVNQEYKKLANTKLPPKEGEAPADVDALQDRCRELESPLKRLLHLMNGNALCLSGGGIRSASYGLGVLEGLARFSVGKLCSVDKDQPFEPTTGLLHHLDYLSTVSGGGYIGSWLSAWIYRRREASVYQERESLTKARQSLESVGSWRDELKKSTDPAIQLARANVDSAKQALSRARSAKLESCYSAVIAALAGTTATTSGDPAPLTVRHLREYTSYLAPSLGLSLDSWTLGAIYLRNLFVNWLMLLPILLAAVALPQVTYFVSKTLALLPNCSTFRSLLVAGVVLSLFIVAGFLAAFDLPSHRKDSNPGGPGLGRVFLGFVLPVMLANWLLVELWWNHSSKGIQFKATPVAATVFVISLMGLWLLCWAIFKKDFQTLKLSAHRYLAEGWYAVRRFLYIFSSGVVAALAAAGMAAFLNSKVFPALHVDGRIFVIFALPILTFAPLLTISLLSALLGNIETEEDREWWSRAGAMQLALITVWHLAHAIALYSHSTLQAVWCLISGVGLGGLGSGLGWSGQTSAGPRPVKSAQLGKLGAFLKAHNLVLPAICGVALLLLTLAVSAGEVRLAGLMSHYIGKLNGPLHISVQPGATTGFELHIFILLVAIVLAILINQAISINVFSLNGLYRMRLMRAFMGASNTERQPDNFTGFDPDDTPTEKDLPQAPGAPLHVINTTLNLVGTKNTAWRQRKAESFSFSPVHCGSWRLGYVPTPYYAGASGPSLATAMTISGAAFNPNMGYHSSPLVTLLMTFFNLRLGWWLPNPAREEGARLFPKLSSRKQNFLRRNAPTQALQPLILEAFGMTDDTYRWIELTDGGHFENLALYEMVLRRCKNIIVVDAGADPDCQFEDLGNALRKIEIDLGIPITFGPINMKPGAQPDNRYCAVATIDYSCVDQDKHLSKEEIKSLNGNLIYIKASLTGYEPPDIRQYSLTHKDFPHESTGNQFFNESQFESYRHLGSFVVETIAKGLRYQSRPQIYEGFSLPPIPVTVSLGTDFSSFLKAAEAYSGKPEKQ
jgi:hypothetical protein